MDEAAEGEVWQLPFRVTSIRAFDEFYIDEQGDGHIAKGLHRKTSIQGVLVPGNNLYFLPRERTDAADSVRVQEAMMSIGNIFKGGDTQGLVYKDFGEHPVERNDAIHLAVHCEISTVAEIISAIRQYAAPLLSVTIELRGVGSGFGRFTVREHSKCRLIDFSISERKEEPAEEAESPDRYVESKALHNRHIDLLAALGKIEAPLSGIRTSIGIIFLALGYIIYKLW